MAANDAKIEGPLSELLDLVVRKEGSAGDVVNWGGAEAVNGHRFPLDYMNFIERLGGGSFEESLDVRLPLVTASDAEHRICPISPEALADPLTHRWTDPDAAATYRVEDMLIWGETAGADTLCWIAGDSAPDAWPIAVYSRNDLAWTVYHCTLTEFILRTLRAEFDACPLSDASLFGLESPRFLTAREETEMMDQGIDPWS
ncbi:MULTISPECIES: SMI1/KNR4 family protein [unclassified Streptomyces]|uniref:SMI1/KNR4 family protein n=1 Tax=unclassified Streptomyces TaxID=2593676 RepID=UPI001BE9AD7B|nr:MULTISPECIES: SMI1/KNR4 family protein [unclassified Streptomyces]MBT2403236.1 SMI1/KNR4 family protein [Streptomyces sp. ISL-21]MBT2610386.1 SMI1/KNR4 family protein [Streptomyces sp. ISL-87]